MIGLTGGIGAGKSAALAAFERLGAATISSDAIVHDLLAGDELKAAARERWGDRVINETGLDREAIGELVFADPDELRWLESELHPRVGERLARWRRELDAELPAAIVEVPLLFETGMEGLFDAVVAVVADLEVRRRRSDERGTSGFAGREQRQMPQAEKETRAQFVIRNDGSRQDLEQAVAGVLAEVAR